MHRRLLSFIGLLVLVAGVLVVEGDGFDDRLKRSSSMTADDFVRHLKKVRRTQDGWSALCPAHGDRKPSLTVKRGADGQIFVKCFAGCEPPEIVAALGLRDEDLSPEGKRPLKVCAAVDVPSVAHWLEATRCLDKAEIGQMFAADSSKGAMVAFRYRDANDRHLYDKFRPINKKGFWRGVSGVRPALYGLWRFADLTSWDRVVVVEGELDAHALWSVGFETAIVSVPDGAGSRIDDALLAPLAPFREVIVATDADESGDTLANKLAAALGYERCRRARFTLDGKGKDANDALKAGWTVEQFEAAFDAAGQFEPMPKDDLVDEEQPSSDYPYQVVEGRICLLRRDRNGGEVMRPLCNFSATIEEEITFDDGAEKRREYRVAGALAMGQTLPVARVVASEFSAMAWVSREWGVRAVMAPGNGAKDHLRCAIQVLSTPKHRHVYRHTGWVEIDGTAAFLYQGGAVGAEGIEVELAPPLDRFRLPDAVEDLPEAVRRSLSFLDIAPDEVTVPLLASAYLAPVATILNPDLAVWLHGVSGSYKSTLSALAQAHFGAFERKILSGSWTSTDNSLEFQLFQLKDVLSVVDDYSPQPDSRAQRDLDRRVHRVIRNVGNRAGRGRLTADLVQRPERPPRGLLLSNGEDLPPGVSIVARLFAVETQRDIVDQPRLTEVQNHASRLQHAMRGYIAWLAPQLDHLRVHLPQARDDLRSDERIKGMHARQPEAIANLYAGFDLFLQFAEHAAGLPASKCEELRARALGALREGATRQTSKLTEIQPAEVFLDAVSVLLAQRKVAFLERHQTPEVGEPEAIGWRHGELALLIPPAAHRRVAMFARDRGEHWAPSLRQLRKDLETRGFVVPAPDGSGTGQWRVGPNGERQRGWIVRLSLLGVVPEHGEASADRERPTSVSQVVTRKCRSVSKKITRSETGKRSSKPAKKKEKALVEGTLSQLSQAANGEYPTNADGGNKPKGGR